ncbi:diacylglycerol pyrophosphate phosphatase [Apophysomyces sp. BC1034]|nr:diacylglycerol pyrophosphate phosphatase [Apophysomyces sp. BC1034]
MISYAEWSPTGHQVAYVMHNDLYVCDLETQSRITYDGSSTVFNGIPDWVYEEEVLQRNYALWWAPDSTHVAYMRFNETSVPEYRLQFYTTSNTSYPDEVSIKYPKPGAQNPLVSLHVYSLLNKTSIMITKNATSDGQAQTDGEHKDFEDHDRLITDVAWATTTHTHLLFKQTNRVQDHEKTSLVEIANNTKISLVRDYKPTDGGWVDISQTMTYLSTTHNGSVVKYLDIAEYNGFMHLAIYTVGQENDIRPTWLTQGEWEVIVGSVVVDKERQLIIYSRLEQVDGRGTGYRGRKYKVGVRGRLGELEAMDQSYGGYLASKVVETNTGVFSTAMAVAPVSDWRYYDSIYTERYMLMPESNAKGYNTSAVSNMTGFENTKYLLVHGTGDDNVHFQHSAVLLDKLTKASIHNYRFQMFTDSNHAMAYHEANQNLYYLLTNFLWESFGGKEYMHIRQESFGHFSGSLDSIH